MNHRLSHLFVIVSGLAAASLLGGCGISPSGGAGATSGSSVATIKANGTVHGGQQPVVGAYVQLYAAGASGYGQGAIPLIQTAQAADKTMQSTVQTDSNGGFSITGTYTCPSATTQVYLTAVNGNPGVGSNNPNAALMAALGSCGALSSSTNILVDEVTSVAAVWALQGFIGYPADGATSLYSAGGSNDGNGKTTAATGFAIGSSSTNTQGLINAFGVAKVLANTTNGSSPGNNVGGTATNVEYGTVNLLANVLAACLNSTGGAGGNTSTACGQLFTYSLPTISRTTTTTQYPVDTLQAAFLIARNPAGSPTSLPDGTAVSTVNTVSNILGIAQPSSPFVPAAATVSDFTIGFNAGPQTACTYNTSNGYAQPGFIAFDTYGNAWIYNLDGNGKPTGGTCSTAGAPYAPYLTEVGPDGSFLTSVHSYTAGGTSVTIGNGQSSALSNTHPPHLVVDSNNNVYAEDHATGNLFAVSGSTAAGVASAGALTANAIATELIPTSPSAASIQNMALDGKGELWIATGVGAASGSFNSSAGYLQGIATSSFASGTLTGYNSGSNPGSNTYGLAVDNTTSGVTNGPFLWSGNTSNCTNATTNGLGGSATTNYGDLYPVNTSGTNVGKETTFKGTDSLGVSTSSCTTTSFPTSLSPVTTAYNGTTYNVTPISEPAVIAFDSGNNMWLWNQEDPAVNPGTGAGEYNLVPDASVARLSPTYNASGTTVSFPTVASGTGSALVTTGGSTSEGGGVGFDVFSIGVDGASSVWVPNASSALSQFAYFASGALYTQGSSYTSPAGVYPVSPSAGWQGSTCTGCTTSGANGQARTLGVHKTVSVDRSGNVWTSSIAIAGTTVTVIVGAATPVATPLYPGSEGVLP